MSRDAMIAELLDGDPNDPTSYEESALPPEHWRHPLAGLKTVRLMLDYVNANPAQFDRYDDVVADLASFERNLTRAIERNVHWHLAMDV